MAGQKRPSYHSTTSYRDMKAGWFTATQDQLALRLLVVVALMLLPRARDTILIMSCSSSGNNSSNNSRGLSSISVRSAGWSPTP